MKSWKLFLLCPFLFLAGFLLAMATNNIFFDDSAQNDYRYYFDDPKSMKDSIEDYAIPDDASPKEILQYRAMLEEEKRHSQLPENKEIDKIFAQLDKAIENLGLDNFEVQNRMIDAFLGDIPEALESINTYPKTQHIMQLWQDREFEKVMGIANKRLEKNPSDLPGLLMKLEYISIQQDFKAWAICAVDVINAAGNAKTKTIKDKLPLMAFEYSMTGAQIRDIAKKLAIEPRTEIKENVLPEYIPFNGFMYLQACETDGLF